MRSRVSVPRNGSGRLLGIEIGGTKLQVVAGDRRGRLIARHRSTVRPEQGAEGIRSQIADLLSRASGGSSIGAIGVGFGGPVDWRSGRVSRSHQVSGWTDFELGRWLNRWTGSPARVDNDANVAALAEAVLGAGRGHDPVFYVTLGSGVGGGLVCGQQIYHGAIPGEAEIGHLRLNRRGTIVEDRCSGWAVNRRIRFLTRSRPRSFLARLIRGDPGHEARHLGAALSQRDPLAMRILDETADALAFALSHAVHLTHPGIIVLGGGLSLVGEPLRRGVAGRLPGYLMAAFRPGPKVALSRLRDEAVPRGALLLAAAAARGAA